MGPTGIHIARKCTDFLGGGEGGDKGGHISTILGDIPQGSEGRSVHVVISDIQLRYRNRTD